MWGCGGLLWPKALAVAAVAGEDEASAEAVVVGEVEGLPPPPSPGFDVRRGIWWMGGAGIARAAAAAAAAALTNVESTELDGTATWGDGGVPCFVPLPPVPPVAEGGGVEADEAPSGGKAAEFSMGA